MRISRVSEHITRLEHKPVWIGVLLFPCGVYGIVRALVALVQSGFGMDTVFWPLVASAMFVAGGASFMRLWTVDIDTQSQMIRWWNRGVLPKAGEIRFADVVGVILPSNRGHRGRRGQRPDRYLALVLADGRTFRLTRFSATAQHASQKLETVASLVRRRLGLDQSSEDEALVDEILASESVVQAAAMVKGKLGVPLAEAKGIVEAVRSV